MHALHLTQIIWSFYVQQSKTLDIEGQNQMISMVHLHCILIR